MIVDCCDNCEFGLKFKKHFSKPVVRFPVLHRFNEYVSMDLKEVQKGNVWILYLIDASTRYMDNGELERNNKVLCEGLMKTMEDAKCDIRQL